MCQSEPTTSNQAQAGTYEIRIQGHLQERWAEWFAEMTIVREENGETSLRGHMVDQAALYGLLRKVRDLGLPLNSVTRIPPATDDAPAPV